MDLSNWNVYFEQWGATLGAYGGMLIIAFKTFILDPINNRRNLTDVSSLKNFVTTTKQDFKQIGQIVYDGMEQMKREVTQEMIAPLLAKIEKKETQQAIFNNMVIMLIANMNVPLAMKEQTFKALSQLDGMNTPYLQEAIKATETQIQAKKVEYNKTTEIVEKLKEV